MKILINRIKTFLASLLSKSNKKFECYEIHRPNIPANGCNTQCKECKELPLSKCKEGVVKFVGKKEPKWYREVLAEP